MNSTPFHQGDKVVAYCRYSEGDEQGLKNQSTEEQADAIRRFCDDNGLQLVRVFADPFASGRSVAKRDHYLEMLSFLLHKKKPDVQGVVLWDFERYGRNYDQAQLDAARLRMAGYKLFSLQQPITDNSPFAHVLEAMYFASAQNQSDMISADVKRSLQNSFTKYKVIPRSCIGFGWIPEAVDMGFFSDGSKRIGYKAVPDPDKADLIRMAVKARLKGASYTQCREILGGKSNLNVKRLFANQLLIGRMTYGETTIEDYCAQIIDRQTFDALQIFERSHPRKQIGRQGGWSADPPMLSGLLYCAKCGDPMYINRRKSKGHLYCTYRCKNKCTAGVRQDVLDPFIIGLCCDRILTEENVRTWISDLSNTDDTEAMQDLIDATEKELSTVERKITTAVDLLLDHPSEALTKRLSEMESRREELRNRLKTLTQRDSDAFDSDTLYKSTIELVIRLKCVLSASTTSDSEKRKALMTFVRSITVSPDHLVRISYIPPSFKPKVVTQHDIVPPPFNDKTGGVVTQSARNASAPPEGTYSESQRIT